MALLKCGLVATIIDGCDGENIANVGPRSCTGAWHHAERASDEDNDTTETRSGRRLLSAIRWYLMALDGARGVSAGCLDLCGQGRCSRGDFRETRQCDVREERCLGRALLPAAEAVTASSIPKGHTHTNAEAVPLGSCGSIGSTAGESYPRAAHAARSSVATLAR